MSTRRMAVRPDLPWYWRTARVVVAVAIVSVAVGWAYMNGSLHDSDTEHTLRRMTADVQRQQTELSELRAKVAQSDRQLQIERATGADLAKQVKQLAFDNAALKEDLGFFQSLSKADPGRETGISLNRLRVQRGANSGEYRYQMLLVQGGAQKEFHGRLEFLVDMQHEGRKVSLSVPDEKERAAADYQLDFRFFQRVDGTFRIALGGEITTLQVRVFENGSRTPKLTQTASVF
jgi:hypothetical protein